MKEILSKLTEYVLLLEEAQEKDNHSENRSLFKIHLADASKMYAHLIKSNDITSINKLVNQADRAHGTSFISGTYGAKIATSWTNLVQEMNIKD